MIKLLDLNKDEANDFFLKKENYCQLNLPPYFDFSKVLEYAKEKLVDGKPLKSYYNSDTAKRPENFDNVNYKLISNKDGSFAWRPLEIIHPMLYVELVNIITEETNWSNIKKRFIDFEKNKNVICCSNIKIDENNKKQQATNINNWWQEFEQEIIKNSLDFSCMIGTDIVGCYESIYTHSIAWALHGKEVAKSERSNKTLIGNKIDTCIRNMRYNQTNGIPQGSALMDFIAEIVLGYADELLVKAIKADESIKLEEYKILRFRDDYRIFTNNVEKAEKILNLLSSVLIDLNMKLNVEKTFVSQNIIADSIKVDKREWRFIDNIFLNEKYIQNKLIILKQFTDKYPNTGTIKKVLTKFYEDVILKLVNLEGKYIRKDIYQIFSILIDMWLRNPNSYSQIAAIISKLLYLLPFSTQEEIIDKIIKKFSSIPNSAYFEIWMQRAIIKHPKIYEFKTNLTLKIYDNQLKLWNSDWLKNFNEDIIDKKKLEEIDAVIQKNEIKIFIYDDY